MQNFGVTNKEHYGMLFYFCSGHDKRWYTTKLLVSLEIPRGNFPYEIPGEGGRGGGYSLLCHTGMYCCTGYGFGPLCLKQGVGIGRDFNEIEDSIIFVPYTHYPDTGN